MKHPVVLHRIVKIKYRKNNKIKLLLIYYTATCFDQHWLSSGNQHHKSCAIKLHDLLFLTEK